jgi:hypothetical protein
MKSLSMISEPQNGGKEDACVGGQSSLSYCGRVTGNREAMPLCL